VAAEPESTISSEKISLFKPCPTLIQPIAQPKPVLRRFRVSNLVFRSLDRRVIGKNGAKELEVSISGPVPADTLWHEALTILCHSGQVRTFGDGGERFLAFKDV